MTVTTVSMLLVAVTALLLLWALILRCNCWREDRRCDPSGSCNLTRP